MALTYDQAFERVIGHEGGYTDDPRDRGNWTSGVIGKGELKGTNFGISAMTYPNLDIKNITLQQAKDIYKVDFWNRVHGEELHNAVAYQLFDAAINHGVGNAIRLLQRALGVADDGRVGPVTLTAAKTIDTNDLLLKFNAQRIHFYTRISTFNTYGRGWMRRIADNLSYAADDYTAPWHEHVAVEAP